MKQIPLTLVCALMAFAQAPVPPVRTVVYYTVKPDRTADFLAATKEFAEEMRKTGSDRTYNVWQAVSGPSEYILASYHPNYAALDVTRADDPKLKDVLPKLNTLSARIMACVSATRRVIAEVDSAHSQPRAATLPKMVLLRRYWAKPEKASELMELLATEMYPAMKKANVPLFTLSRVRYGGSAYEVHITRGMEKWADTDGESTVVRALGGKEAYDRYVGRLRPLLTDSDVQVYKLLPEQSYSKAKP